MEHRKRVALWCALIAGVAAISAHAAESKGTGSIDGANTASVGRQPMVKINMEWIEACAQRFLSKAYGRAEVEMEFGVVQSDTNPNLLQLAPKDARFSHIELVMAEVGGQQQPGALHIELRDPVTINLQQVIQRHGQPREVPRLHPTQPVTYAFEVRGKDFAGQLMLGFSLEPLKDKKHILRDFRVVRIAE